MDNRTARTRQQHSPSLRELGDAYERYLDTLSISPSTIEAYRGSLRLFLRGVPPDIRADHVSELDIQRWMKARRDAGISPNTLRSDLRRLRAGFFAWGVARKAFRQEMTRWM